MILAASRDSVRSVTDTVVVAINAQLLRNTDLTAQPA